MGLSRAWRRHRKPTVDQQLAVITESVENLATDIFHTVVVNGLSMPPRSSVESAMKAFMIDYLAPARQQAIDAGKPVEEVETYAAVVSSHAQIAFQTKWAELERRQRDIAGSGAMH